VIVPSNTSSQTEYFGTLLSGVEEIIFRESNQKAAGYKLRCSKECHVLRIKASDVNQSTLGLHNLD